MKKGGGGGVGCELCGETARIYCESDRASLCWGCDHKVHGANFLVGKHTRSLLCHRCQAPTPWTSSGSKIPPCMAFCLACLSLVSANSNLMAASGNPHTQSQPQQVQRAESSSTPDEDEEEEEHEEGYTSYSDDDDGDEDENQVVPWSPSSAKSVSGSSDADVEEKDDDDEDEDEDEEDDVAAKIPLFSSSLLKRKRDSTFLHSSDNRNTIPRP